MRVWAQGTTRRIRYTPKDPPENFQDVAVRLTLSDSRHSQNTLITITEAQKSASEIVVTIPAAATATKTERTYYLELRLDSTDPVYSATPIREEVRIVATHTSPAGV